MKVRLFEMFEISQMEPVAFFPYTSSVRRRIFEMEYEHNDEISQLRDYFIKLFKRHGIKAYLDNKTVFKLSKNGTPIYYGWYDGRFSIGLYVWSEHSTVYTKGSYQTKEVV